MSWLSSFFHPERGYKAGQDQLDKYYNQGQGYLDPYNQHGQSQYGNLNSYINNLMHPEKLQDEWIKNYHESEQAKNLENAAQQHGLNAAGSMGLSASTPALQAIQAGTSQIGAADRQQYLNDLMQKYMSGAGLSQGIYGQGAGAAGQQSQNAMNMGQNSAGMAYGQKNAQGNLLGNLLGTGAGLFGSYMGGRMGQNPGWGQGYGQNPNNGWSVARSQ